MDAHDLLHHLRKHFAAQLGPRACAVLYPAGMATTRARAVLALAALRAVGAENLPDPLSGDWLEAGRGLVRAELVSLGERPRYLSEENVAAVERKLAATLTPQGLLSLYAHTREAVRRAERAYAAARHDGLHLRPEERHAAQPDFCDLPESERLTAA